MPDKYLFLADDWFVAAAAVLQRSDDAMPDATDLLINVEVTDSPFGERQFHAGASGGMALLAPGHLERTDLVLTMDYDTARELFVSGDTGAAMQAFIAGRIRIQGDFAKLIAVGQGGGGPGSPTIAAALHAITE